MSTPSTRAQFIAYCKRRLGHPVIEINVDDDQVEDRVEEALEFWQDYHFDGSEKLYLKHQLTQEDFNRKYIHIPDKIFGVTGVLPFQGASSSVNMFDLRYQLRLHDLYDFTSVSYVSYEITMQHLRTIEMLFSGAPQFRFHRHRNRLHLDINWNLDLKVGDWIVIECYGKISPDRVNLTGTYNITTSSNVITSSVTSLDAEVITGDEAYITTANGDVAFTIGGITPTSMNTNYTFSTTETGLTAYMLGNVDVWNDRVLKDLGTALIKLQWGSNMKKFSGVQMPGGVTLNGQVIYDEAVEEIKAMKQEFLSWNTLQSDWFVG